MKKEIRLKQLSTPVFIQKKDVLVGNLSFGC